MPPISAHTVSYVNTVTTMRPNGMIRGGPFSGRTPMMIGLRYR